MPLYDYCRNRVLNALLSGFAERCEKEQISFTVKIELLPYNGEYTPVWDGEKFKAFVITKD